MSTTELMELTGKSEGAIKAALRQIQAKGCLAVHLDKRLAIDGRYRPIPVYAIQAAK